MALTLGAVQGGTGQSFTIHDFTERGFAPDVVNYTIELSRGEAEKLRLTDAAGRPIALQVSAPDKQGQAVLSFVAALPANSNVTFTLNRDGQGALGNSELKVVAEGGALVLANGLCAVKLPGPVEKTFSSPVSASTLPAPILAFRSGASGPWWGAGKVLSERKVSAWRVKPLAQGPVFAEVQYELEYAGGGYYRASVRLADRVPMACVIEEYDLGRMAGSPTVVNRVNETQEAWELNLTQGWNPDTFEKSKAFGNGGGGDTGVYGPLAGFKSGTLVNAGAYSSDYLSGFGLFRAADKNAGTNYPGVGVTPLHNGSWRRAMVDLYLLRPAADQVALRLPMTRTTPNWVETSPFCVALQDPSKPYTYASRQWGLVLGALPVVIPAQDGNTTACRTYQARLTYGVIGLDRYKDFILDWPDAKSDKALAGINYSIPDGAAANRSLAGIVRTAMGFVAQSHHAVSDAYANVTGAGNALRSPNLPDLVRKELRARLALIAYLFVDADINGQGSGSHTGNPNMSLARQGWVSAAIALLPDHPMYAAWRDYMTAWTEFKLADNMAPAGGWFEPGNYHEWGYWRLIWGLTGLEAMKVHGVKGLVAYHSADSDFYMNLLTPVDSRWGTRMVPGFGNNANHHTDMFRDAAIALIDFEPKQAAELVWAWQADNVAPVKAPPVLASIQPKEPALTSRYFPGFGLIFRAHQGPDETYMLLRSGFLWSHWTVDQGNVALYSKGAALLPTQPYGYFTSALLDHSQECDIRFGHPANEFRCAWPDSNVLDYRFGARVQYAWASAGYPEWFITPGLTEGWQEAVNFAVGFLPKLEPGLKQKEGAFWWNRQIAFLIGKTPRSPNYFVFHDTISGEGRLAQWFNLDVIGCKKDVQVQGNKLSLSTEWPVSLEMTFADNRTLAPTLAEQNQLLNTQGRGSPNWVRSDGKPVDAAKGVMPDSERHVLVRIPAEAGADHFWVAYPKAQAEAAPTVERLASNVVKVTHSEGTDYILLSAAHDRFEGKDVVLEGQAASVRVAPEGVTFALLGGSGRVGYKGQIFESATPFERTVALNVLQPGVQTVSDPSAASMSYAPQLKDHQPVAPGVTKASDAGRTEYRVENAVPVVFREGDVQIEARQTLVLRGPDSVRFVAPEGTYVQLVAGKSAVRGLGPFDLTIMASNITGAVAGNMRTLVISKPEGIIRPMYVMDKVRWYAGYPDDPAPYRGRSEAQFSLAFGVTAGKHAIEVREWESPEMPPVVSRRILGQ